VVRGGASLIDDHTTVSALNFLQDQNTWILNNSSSTVYGEKPTATADLQDDPRFTSINSLPAGSIATPTPIVRHTHRGLGRTAQASGFTLRLRARLRIGVDQPVQLCD